MGRGYGLGRVVLVARGEGGVSTWRVHWTDSSGRHKKVIRGTKSDADQYLVARIRERQDAEAGITRAAGVVWGELKASWLSSRKKVVPAVRTRWEHTLKTFGEHAGLADTTLLPAVGGRTARVPDHVNAWLRDMSSLSVATRRDKAWVVCSVFTHAAERGFFLNDPLGAVRGRLVEQSDVRKRQPRALTSDELSRLLEACKQLSGGWKDEALVVRFLSDIGCRFGEAADCRVSQFSPDFRTWTVPAKNTKARRESVKVVPDGLAALLAERAAATRGGVLLTIRDVPVQRHTVAHMRRYLRRALALAHIARVTEQGRVHIHALRNTFVTRHIMKNVPTLVVARQLGHTSTRMVDREYARISVEDQRAALCGA